MVRDFHSSADFVWVEVSSNKSVRQVRKKLGIRVYDKLSIRIVDKMGLNTIQGKLISDRIIVVYITLCSVSLSCSEVLLFCPLIWACLLPSSQPPQPPPSSFPPYSYSSHCHSSPSAYYAPYVYSFSTIYL
jgi:hypothetical protein